MQILFNTKCEMLHSSCFFPSTTNTKIQYQNRLLKSSKKHHHNQLKNEQIMNQNLINKTSWPYLDWGAPQTQWRHSGDFFPR